MSRIRALLKQRQILVESLSNYSLAIAGNLSRSKVPPNSGKYYWRLTWKEKQTTKIKYVKKEDQEKVKEGIQQFARLRKTILKLGEINRAILVLQSRNIQRQN